MKTMPTPLRRQSGIALFLFLVLLVLAGSYAFYRTANVSNLASGRDGSLSANMAQAKDALIAYAVTDDQRLGRLLCPDLVGDGISPTLSRNDCESYAGWLPWKTLDLANGVDDHGTPLRYVALRWFGGDRITPPINSDTLSATQLADALISQATLPTMPQGLLFLDTPAGSGANDLSNDIVALVIAPRGKLDSRNADGDNYYFTGQSDHEDDNDFIMPVTRQELMAAVEKRVANEVKSCVQNHAANNPKRPFPKPEPAPDEKGDEPQKVEKRFPWPAPLSANSYQGKAGALFGQMPLTQPSPSANSLLKDALNSLNGNIADLQNSRAANGNDFSVLVFSVNTLSTTLFQIRNLLDSLYIAATELWQAATALSTNLSAVNLTTDNALQPSGSRRTVRVTNVELTNIQTGSNTVFSGIDNLPAQLDASGIDIYPEELARRTKSFTDSANVTTATSIEEMLWSTHSVHVDISPRLQSALDAATLAREALQSPIQADAALKAKALTDAISCLQKVIAASRINTHYSEIAALIAPIQAALIAYEQTPSPVTASALQASLTAAQANIGAVATLNPQSADCGTGATAIIGARNSAMSALLVAQQSLNQGLPLPTIQSDSNVAIGKITALVTAMTVNDDNLTRTSVKAWVDAYKTQHAALPNLGRLSSTARVPYVANYQIVAVNLENWAKTIANHAAELASKIKAAPISDDAYANVKALDGSTYAFAAEALNSSLAAASALTSAINTPTDLKKGHALEALSELLGDAANLSAKTDQLSGSFSSSTASALPIVWLAKQCDAFRQTANAWWRKGAWQDLVFYQISNIDSTLDGKLTINGIGNHRLVVISAGRRLYLPQLPSPTPDPPYSWQNRSTRSTVNYFECADSDPKYPDRVPIQCNNHSSRDGNAATPDTKFWGAPPTRLFNDRLAY